MDNMKILNLLWDINGTLFDTHPAVTYVFAKTLNELGQSVAMNVLDELIQQHSQDCVPALSQRFKLDPHLLRAKFRDSYRAVSLANQLPFPGVRAVCEYIHQNGGLNIAVTHLGVGSTQKLLDAHEMTTLIDGIVSAEQGYPNKPDPAMVLAALSKYSLNPDETLLVGDQDRDIQAGRAAGVRTCLFGNVPLSHPSDFQIEHFSYLLALLQEANR